MNRTNYYDLCSRQLAVLTTQIERNGELNLLHLHIHCEDFYAGFLNLLLGYSLNNTNQTAQNSAGIDLVDSAKKIVVQVSATATKEKINTALSRTLAAYAGHAFEFVSISRNADHLRSLQYTIPHTLKFNPASDIHDPGSLLNRILHSDIVTQKKVSEFLISELSAGRDRIPVESNIAEVIRILASEDLSIPAPATVPTAFDIDEKLSFNSLNAAAEIVEEHKIHQGRVGRIYAEFDANGRNKSRSVLNSLRNSYLSLSAFHAADELFFRVVDSAMKTIQESANYKQMPLEELELCVHIIAVDAFLRCRIFKNPTGGSSAVA